MIRDYLGYNMMSSDNPSKLILSVEHSSILMESQCDVKLLHKILYDN